MDVNQEDDSKALCTAHTDALLPFIQSVCVGEVDLKLQLPEKCRVAMRNISKYNKGHPLVYEVLRRGCAGVSERREGCTDRAEPGRPTRRQAGPPPQEKSVDRGVHPQGGGLSTRRRSRDGPHRLGRDKPCDGRWLEVERTLNTNMKDLVQW